MTRRMTEAEAREWAELALPCWGYGLSLSSKCDEYQGEWTWAIMSAGKATGYALTTGEPDKQGRPWVEVGPMGF